MALDLNKKLWSPTSSLLKSVSPFFPTMKDGESVFVMTNMVITPRQHQGECAENHFDFRNEICTSDDNCTKGEPVEHGHGKQKFCSMLRISTQIFWGRVENQATEIQDMPRLMRISRGLLKKVESFWKF